MSDGQRQLVYFDQWMDPSGAAKAAALAGIDAVCLDSAGPEDENWRVLATAHGHQMRASTETPEIYKPRRDFFQRCPNLLAIASAGAGYDMVDLDACSEAGVLLFNQSGSNAESVAQHVLAMMLTLSKELIQSDRAMRSERRDWTRWDYTGRELTNRTVGIVGLGHIGRRVSALCAGLFGMKVLAYDPHISDDDMAARGAERRGNLEDMFREADFISVNCPLTTETRGMVSGPQFGVMKPTAYFVNTARGGIHDEAALEAALLAGKLAGAGLDVFEHEPPPVDHPLLAFGNVLVSPHNAGVTDDANVNMDDWAIGQWADVFAGKRPMNLINPDAWDAFAGRYQAAFGLAAAE